MIALDKIPDAPEKVKSLTYTSKLSSDDDIKDLLTKLSFNFDCRHNKISLINRSRKFISYFFKTSTRNEKTLKATNTKDFVSEYFYFTTNSGCDIIVDIRTNKTFLQNFSIGSGITLLALNTSIEKMGTLIDIKTKKIIREYFWDIITSTTDCVYDCNAYSDEYNFRFLDRTSKTTIEVTILK